MVSIRDIRNCFNRRHNIVLHYFSIANLYSWHNFLIKPLLVFIKATCLVVPSVYLLWWSTYKIWSCIQSCYLIASSQMLFQSLFLSSQIRVIDAVRYRKVHEEVMKKLDKLENEFLPQVMVDNTEVIFDTIRYLEPQTRDLIIANTGQVSASATVVYWLQSCLFLRWKCDHKRYSYELSLL